jgi:hypothetical protein
MSGAGLERAFRLSVLADAAVARAHADHAPVGGALTMRRIGAVQHMLTGKAPEQIDALGFDLRGEPLRESAQRDDVVAVVLERRRRDRQAQLAALGQEVDVVVIDGRPERRAL